MQRAPVPSTATAEIDLGMKQDLVKILENKK